MLLAEIEVGALGGGVGLAEMCGGIITTMSLAPVGREAIASSRSRSAGKEC